MARIALIGTGWQGQGLLNFLIRNTDCEVVGICDVNEEMLNKAASKFDLSAFSDYEKMFDDTRPDGVVICTPPTVRVPLVQAAAERGIHCFIEKPPAKTLEMAEEVSRILNKTKVMNSVGFMYRYSKAVEKCKALLEGRKISQVRSAMLDGLALRPDWPKWFFDKERSGGPVFDQAIHIMDVSRYLLGEVKQTVGFRGNLIKPKTDAFTVEDSISYLVQYENDILQTHTHSWVYADHVAELEFISDQLHLTLDIGNGCLTGTIDGEQVLFESEDTLYSLELDAFIQAINNNRPDFIKSTYADSIKSLSVALAVSESLEEEKIVTM